MSTDATPEKVTRETVLTLAYAVIADPASGLGPEYYKALAAYAEQEGLTPEEFAALNEEAEAYAYAQLDARRA